MTQELAQINHTELATATRPMGSGEYREAVAEAGEKAKVLAEVVESCNLYATISGRKYLTVEAWQTIGVGYGITARVDWTRPLEGGGWEARAVAVNASNMEVGAAECEAGRPDDKPWDSRPSYQQRSMAQTRAVSKSLRSCLSWIVVLAGYSPTPAEEMIQEEKQTIQNPARAALEAESADDGPGQCPLHPGEYFERFKGFRDGDPDEWKHKNGLWPEDHSNKNIAGKNRWCRPTDPEVKTAFQFLWKAVTPQPEPTIGDMFEEIEAVEEDDKPY